MAAAQATVMVDYSLQLLLRVFITHLTRQIQLILDREVNARIVLAFVVPFWLESLQKYDQKVRQLVNGQRFEGVHRRITLLALPLVLVVQLLGPVESVEAILKSNCVSTSFVGLVQFLQWLFILNPLAVSKFVVVDELQIVPHVQSQATPFFLVDVNFTQNFN